MSLKTLELIISGAVGALLTIPLTALFNYLLKRYEFRRRDEQIATEHLHAKEMLELELLRKHQYELQLLEIKQNKDDSSSDILKRLEKSENLYESLLSIPRLPQHRREIGKLRLDKTNAGRELIRVLQSPPGLETDFEKPLSDENTTIALWGPKGTGKTSLILAFAASLYKYNTNNVVIHITNENGELVNPFNIAESRSIQEGSQYPETTLYNIIRRYKKAGLSSKISSHSHKLLIRDDKGGALVDMLENPDAYALTFDSVVSADGVIITLDPTLVKDYSYTNEESVMLTRNEYVDIVRRLCELIKSHSHGQQLLSFCVTKVDWLGGYGRLDAVKIVERLFGLEMIELMNNVSGKAFATSAHGFHYSRGIASEYPSEWEPYQVELPVFWMLESIEENRLANNHYSSISKYSKKSIIEHYIPYSSMGSS